MAKENNNEIINSLHSICPDDSPPTEYIDWNNSKQNTIIDINTIRLFDFEFNEIAEIGINEAIKIRYPCVIQTNDITNIIKLASIQHEESKLEIKNVIKYNPEEYFRHCNGYMQKKNSAIARFDCNKSINSHKELIGLIAAKKENDAAMEVKLTATVEKYTRMGFKFRTARRTLQKIWLELFDYAPIDDLNFWDIITSVDMGQFTTVVSWKVPPLYILYIIQTEVYENIYNTIRDAVLPHISEEQIQNTGIIHYVIFRNKTVYDCVMESPEFIMFILEDGIINIPKYLVAKLSG